MTKSTLDKDGEHVSIGKLVITVIDELAKNDTVASITLVSHVTRHDIPYTVRLTVSQGEPNDY